MKRSVDNIIIRVGYPLDLNGLVVCVVDTKKKEPVDCSILTLQQKPHGKLSAIKVGIYLKLERESVSL